MNYLQFFYLNRYIQVANRNEDASERRRKLFSKGHLSNFKVWPGYIRAIDPGKANRNKKWLEI